MKKISMIAVVLAGWFCACSRPSHPTETRSRIEVLPDAGVAENARREADAAVEVAASAILVDPSTCRDDSVHAARALWRPGTTMWHLCYTTPRPRTSTSRLAGERPERVIFTLREAEGTATRDLIVFEAPRVADPWTASVVIAVPDPPDGVPLFNVRNDYGNQIGSLLAVDRNWNGTALDTHGILRLWRLNRYGVSARSEFAVVANECTELMGPEPDLAGSYFPIGSPCPADLAICPAWRYHCPAP